MKSITRFSLFLTAIICTQVVASDAMAQGYRGSADISRSIREQFLSAQIGIHPTSPFNNRSYLRPIFGRPVYTQPRLITYPVNGTTVQPIVRPTPSENMSSAPLGGGIPPFYGVRLGFWPAGLSQPHETGQFVGGIWGSIPNQTDVTKRLSYVDHVIGSNGRYRAMVRLSLYQSSGYSSPMAMIVVESRTNNELLGSRMVFESETTPYQVKDYAVDFQLSRKLQSSEGIRISLYAAHPLASIGHWETTLWQLQ